jgi:hypothetical protein
MARYAIMATINYIDGEVYTDNTKDLDVDNIRSWIAKLLETEPEATSFQVIIVPSKTKRWSETKGWS